MDTIEKTAAVLRKSMPESVRKRAFRVAHAAYVSAGRSDCRTCGAFLKLAHEDPGPRGNPLATAVHAALGRVFREFSEVEKAASQWWNPVYLAGRIAGGGAGTAAQLMKAVPLAGLTVGAAGGGGLFALKRHLEKDDVKTRKLQRQRAIMKRLTEEIDQELKIRGLDPTPENQAAVVDYLT